MKTSIFVAFFGLALAASLFLAPRAEAMVMVKNYTRYTGVFVEPVEYAEVRVDGQEKIDERPRFTGWKAILNIFLR